MKIENVEIYGLKESIVASGYPMVTNTDNFDYEVANLSYWMDCGVLDYFINNPTNIAPMNNKTSCKICGDNKKVQQYKGSGDYYCNRHYKMIHRYGEIKEVNRLSPNQIKVEKDHAILITRDKNDKDNGEFLIDFEDVQLVIDKKWHNDSLGYCRSSQSIALHRLIMGVNDDSVVDHINRNKFDNRRCNLRIADKHKNSFNSNLYTNNTSSIIGVNFRSDRNKWRAYITLNNKQKSLGSFKDKECAIVARLVAEKELFKEFSPQRHLFEQYGIKDFENEEKINEYKFKPNLYRGIKHFKRLMSLGNSKPASGHDQALTGIIVQFDLTFSNKAWVELQRYHFIDFVSSQSTIHRISKFDLETQYNEYVNPRIISIMEELKDIYNTTNDKEDYLRLLYSNPCGFQLTARMTTNYRQLKTMYYQRKNHKLPEWRAFCDWCLTLPQFKELIGLEE